MPPFFATVDAWYASLPPQPRMLLGLGVLLLLAVLALLATRRVALRVIGDLVRRTRTFWDEVLIERRVFHRLSWVVPLLVFNAGLPFVQGLPPSGASLLRRAAAALMVMVLVRAGSAFLAGVGEIYNRYPVSRQRPIKGYLQTAALLLYLLGGIVAVGLLIDRSPGLLLSGIGAMTAVLLLIFRDTLLSLVAGVQITANQLIRVGDWIEMPQFDADGDVIDIALNTVRVQNWDRTITAIPTHKFLEHSYRNWRGMQESGGRRIKRSLHIDTSTIRFLDEEEVARFRRFVLLRDYMAAKEEELERYNRERLPDPGFVANARRLTNVGTFRAYVASYLRQHPGIDPDSTFLVRQLQPTPQGLPLEIYVFASDTRWAAYEGIQADVFDHLLAIVGEFGLRVYQQPSGTDVASLRVPAPPAPGGAPAPDAPGPVAVVCSRACMRRTAPGRPPPPPGAAGARIPAIRRARRTARDSRPARPSGTSRCGPGLRPAPVRAPHGRENKRRENAEAAPPGRPVGLRAARRAPGPGRSPRRPARVPPGGSDE